ncbi:MAG: hypothetical protein IKJ80_00480 [Clostridia bacterium]|nr:hypothetical protein [Clostridia bacterium]
MTDKKFTDEEIAEALECCSKCDCKHCPCYAEDINGCKEIPTDEILDLIKRQRAENESLQEAIGRKEDIMRKMCDQKRAYYDELVSAKAEIERLESLCEKIGIANDAKFERICVLQEDLETAKSESVKEFAELEFLEAEMAKIFRKEGFPQSFVDDMLGPVDANVKEEKSDEQL